MSTGGYYLRYNELLVTKIGMVKQKKKSQKTTIVMKRFQMYIVDPESLSTPNPKKMVWDFK